MKQIYLERTVIERIRLDEESVAASRQRAARNEGFVLGRTIVGVEVREVKDNATTL